MTTRAATASLLVILAASSAWGMKSKASNKARQIQGAVLTGIEPVIVGGMLSSSLERTFKRHPELSSRAGVREWRRDGEPNADKQLLNGRQAIFSVNVTKLKGAFRSGKVVLKQGSRRAILSMTLGELPAHSLVEHSSFGLGPIEGNP